MRSSLILTVLLAWLVALAAAAPASAVTSVPPAGGGLVLTVSVGPDGAIRASGTVPRAFPLDELGKRIDGLDLTATTRSELAGNAEAWARALDALTVILPRLAEGNVLITPARLDVSGRLRPGFSAEDTRSAVRLTLGENWETRLDIAEAPPAPEFAVTWTSEGAVASGILPDELEPEEALALLPGPGEGVEITGGGLTGGGAGDPAVWRAALELVGRLLPAFRHADVRLSGAGLTVEGALAPGHDAERIERWLAERFADRLADRLGGELAVTIEPAEAPAAEGDTLRDPVTGETRRLVRGHWLPVHDFTPGPAACGWRARLILARTPVGFQPGEAALAEGNDAALNRLAGLARHCLNRGGLELEIGGHTDSRGEAEENLALSEQRAMAVLRELALRGVPADAMTALGHGQTRPVADNDTEAGRARNRRITFDWSE